VGETAAAALRWHAPAEPTDGEQKHPISCRHAARPAISHLALLGPDCQGRPQNTSEDEGK